MTTCITEWLSESSEWSWVLISDVSNNWYNMVTQLFVSDCPFVNDCPFMSDCPFVSDCLFVSDCPFVSDYPFVINCTYLSGRPYHHLSAWLTVNMSEWPLSVWVTAIVMQVTTRTVTCKQGSYNCGVWSYKSRKLNWEYSPAIACSSCTVMSSQSPLSCHLNSQSCHHTSLLNHPRRLLIPVPRKRAIANDLQQ